MTTSERARTDGEEFVEASRLFLKEDFLRKLVGCLEGMSEEDLWWRPNEHSNSVGNLVLHLCGNMRQWIVASIANIRSTVVEVDRVLVGLATSRLLERLRVQGDDTSVLQAIYHVVEHFSYHLGQIRYVQKLRSGPGPAG